MTTARKRGFPVFASAALCVALAAEAAPARDALSVVATTGMIADAAREVGGERVETRALMGPGVDPHAYRQTRSDIVALANADLVLRHGLYLEAQLEDLLLDLAEGGNVVAVAEGLPRELLISHDVYDDKPDPHVWMDPGLWRLVVGNVRDALIATDLDGEAHYRANAEAYLAELRKLERYAEDALASVPPENRVLVTAHDAFNYFGAAYGYEVAGIQGISTESEAGLHRVSELVDMLVARNVRAIFVETSVSDRGVRALVEGAAAEGREVAIGGELYSDAMGEDGSYEGTYVGMIDRNVTTIAAALGGSAPDGGMNGALY